MTQQSDPSIINKTFKEKIETTKCPEKKQKLIKRYRKALQNLEERSLRTMTYVGQIH